MDTYFDATLLKHIGIYDHGNGIRPTKLREITQFAEKTFFKHLNDLVVEGLIRKEKIKGKKQGVIYKIRISHKLVLNLQNTCNSIFELFEFHIKNKKGNVKGSIISELIKAISDFERALLYLKLTHKDGDAVYKVGKNILDDYLSDIKKLIKKNTRKIERDIAGQELKFVQDCNPLNHNFSKFFLSDKQYSKLDLIPITLNDIRFIISKIPENNSETMTKKEKSDYLKKVIKFRELMLISRESYLMLDTNIAAKEIIGKIPKDLSNSMLDLVINTGLIFENKGTSLFDRKTGEEIEEYALSSISDDDKKEAIEILRPLMKILKDQKIPVGGDKYDEVRENFIKSLPIEQQKKLDKSNLKMVEKHREKSREIESQVYDNSTLIKTEE